MDQDTARDFIGTATYSPEDNKLRLYPFARLATETYERVRAAGFNWAAKQELFVAPMWTPSREDLLVELCGEIDDEDTSLVERAEERADRFEDYEAHRRRDAESARKNVETITNGIPLGQPILVGHHSERHARRDAARIEAGMRKAVKMWNTAQYWKDRAQGAIHAAKYKERPDVRARRIKTLEADLRKHERTEKEARALLSVWKRIHEPDSMKRKDGQPTTIEDRAKHLANVSRDYGFWTALDRGTMTGVDVQASAIAQYEQIIAHAARWTEHLTNRLTYERAMLEETGYIQPRPKPSRAALPLLNYPEEARVLNPWSRGEVETFTPHPMTKAEFAKIHNDYKGTRISEDGTHRVRIAMLRHEGKTIHAVVFLTDSKRHPKPGAPGGDPKEARDIADRIEKGKATLERQGEAAARIREHNRGVLRAHTEGTTTPAPTAPQDAEAFAGMKETLNAGVVVVSTPTLFATPPELAARMVELANITPDHRVLEPSAGTGALLRAIGPSPYKVAVEISFDLVRHLMRGGAESGTHIHHADFLECGEEELGTFDRVVMNPPFDHGADIRHIEHARRFLRPGGLLVALCANGPRQQAAFRAQARAWYDLPPGTFRDAGTMVNTALLVLEG